MTDEPFLPRYLIRQGTSGLMVWDRHAKGPAKLNGQPAIGLEPRRSDTRGSIADAPAWSVHQS
jgi:hypothetical protein